MKNLNEYGIYDIEAMTEQEAQNSASEQMTIKGHQIYFVNFGGYFGYSCLVFKNGKQIKYCNDYQLHHNGKTTEELQDYYIKKQNGQLFTEEELTDGAKDYDEYSRKMDYLTNNFVYSLGFVSAWYIGKPDEEQEKASKTMYYCPVVFGYLAKKEDAAKVAAIYKNLCVSYRRHVWENPENFRKMMRYECANHEVGYSGDWEQMLYSMGEDINKWQEWQKQIYFEEVRRAERLAG